MASRGKANRRLSEARAPELGEPGLCHDARVLSISASHPESAVTVPVETSGEGGELLGASRSMRGIYLSGWALPHPPAPPRIWLPSFSTSVGLQLG